MPEKHEVLMVMYDLPVKTSAEKRQYTSFRKTLLSMGFTDLQKSVYIKLVRNSDRMPADIEIVKYAVPAHGQVYILPMTLRTFQAMETIVGNNFQMSFFSDDIIVV